MRPQLDKLIAPMMMKRGIIFHLKLSYFHRIIKFTTPNTQWHTMKPAASTTAGRFFRSMAKRMNAAQGGRVSKRITNGPQ